MLHIILVLLLRQYTAQEPPDVSGSEIITLDRAVTEALAHNLDLLAERAQVPIVDSRMIAARLRPNPTFNISADHLDFLGTGFSPTNGAGPSEFSLNTEFTWERSAKRERRIEVAEKERTIAEYELRDSIRRLTYEVQNTFIDVLLAQESLALARENLASLTRIADINTARVSAGDLSEVELARTKVAVLEVENTVSRAGLTLRDLHNRLGLLLGRTTTAQRFEAAGEFRRDTVPPESAEQVVLERRPDLMAAAAEEARASADVRLQLAQGHRDVTFGTEYRRQQGINGTGNSLGFTASVPLLLFNQNQGEIARAHAEKRKATLKVAALRASVLVEAKAALDQRDTARAQLERIESVMLVQARRVREITEYAYQRGEASFLQLLDAERTYNDTMQSHLNARAGYARSLYLIDAVTAKEVHP